MTEQITGGAGGQPQASPNPETGSAGGDPQHAAMLREVMAAQARRAAVMTTAVDPKQIGPMDDVPLSVRVAVAGARPEDKLATLQKWTGAGNAKLHVTGGESLVDGKPVYREPQQEIVFTHPGSGDRPDLKGKQMRYDPHWYDAGELINSLTKMSMSADVLGNEAMKRAGLRADTSTTKERALDAAEGLATDTLGIAGGEVAGMAAKEGMFGLRSLSNLKKVEKFDVAGKGRPQIAEDLGTLDVSAKGATPMLTDSATIQGAWNAASKSPRAADRIRQAWNETWGDIQNAWHRTTGMRGTVERPSDVSEGLAARYKEYGTAASQTQEQLETGAAQLRKSEDTAMAATRNALDKALAKGQIGGKDAATARDTVPAFLKRLDQDMKANGDTLPFEDARTLRQTYDLKAGHGGDAEGMEQAYRDVADAIRVDLKNKMKSEGAEAGESWDQAMSHWAQHKDTQKLLGPIMQGKDPGRSIATSIANGTMDKPTLRALRSIASDELWDNTARGTLVKLGEVTRAGGEAESGAFSMIDFAKRWKGLDPEARDLLYAPGTEQRKNLDALARISNAYADASASRAYQGAASQNAFFGAIEGGPGKVVGTIAKGLESVAAPLKSMGKVATAVGDLRAAWKADDSAKLLTDPAFQKWLIEGGKIDPGKTEAVAKHVTGLSTLMYTRPLIREQILKYAQNLKAELQQQYEQPQEAAPKKTGIRASLDELGEKIGFGRKKNS